MSTYLNQNQFTQTPVLGQVDFTVSPNIKSVKINPSSVATVLQSGQAFKIVDVAGPEIIVDVAAITDVAYGVAIYNPKKNLFTAGQTIELGCVGTVIYLEASAAIARGAGVALDPTGPTVATVDTATQATIGECLDKPTAAATLARIEIRPSSIVTS
jgi:hypothetical protein